MDQLTQELLKRVQVLEAKESIRNLQAAYAFYLERWMADEVSELFANHPETNFRIAAGEFQGKDRIREYFKANPFAGNPEFLHQVMPVGSYITVNEDCTHAYARWYGFGPFSLPTPDGVSQNWMNGIYENEYIVEDGVWKIFKIHWCILFNAPYTEGWVEPNRRIEVPSSVKAKPNIKISPDVAAEVTEYPSGYFCPLHFKNPVTEE